MNPLLARFDSAKACRYAILKLKERGTEDLEAFMPYPEKSIERALDMKKSPLPKFVFLAGLTGALLAYAIMWYTNVIDFPINVGGRPDHAVPAFIPLTFETTVLFAGVAAFLFAFILGGLPRYYDPIFEVEEFDRVMVDGWFVAVSPKKNASASNFDREELVLLLERLGAKSVSSYGHERKEAS